MNAELGLGALWQSQLNVVPAVRHRVQRQQADAAAAAAAAVVAADVTAVDGAGSRHMESSD